MFTTGPGLHYCEVEWDGGHTGNPVLVPVSSTLCVCVRVRRGKRRQLNNGSGPTAFRGAGSSVPDPCSALSEGGGRAMYWLRPSLRDQHYCLLIP